MKHDISQDAEEKLYIKIQRWISQKAKYTSIHQKPKEQNTLVYIYYNKASKTQLRKANTHQALLASG